MRKFFFGIFILLFLKSYGTGVKMTKEQLQEYDGKNGKIYFACGGIIFDASNDKNFKEGGKDHGFAGKDATVSLVRMDYNEKWIGMDPEKAELTPYMKNAVQNWIDLLKEKYPIVGELVKHSYERVDF